MKKEKKLPDCWFIPEREMNENDWEIIARVDGVFHYFTEGKAFELVPVDFEDL